MASQDAPVLIAGGGLVGLSTAMFLAQHGVSSIAIERLTKPSTLPRAAFFHMRTFELFRQAGIEDQVRAQSQVEFEPDGAIVAVESLTGRELASIIPSLNEGVAEVSPCRRWFVSQPGLEPILRRRAEDVGASVINGKEVLGVRQDADGVSVSLRDVEDGIESELRGSYLIACEGAHSKVRDQLGVQMEGRGVFSNSVTIYLRANLAPYLVGRNFSIIYINNAEMTGFFRLEKDSQRGFLVVSTLGDPIADPEKASNAAVDISHDRLVELVRIAAGVPDLEVEIEGVARWRCTSDVASSYRDGRVFLAGDTAHLMPTNGGFGGNTGVHDAHNLAWKMAMVLKGVARPALLDTYEAERRPAGKFTVEQAYTRYLTRSAPYLAAKDYQPLVSDFEIEIGYIYASPAILTEPGSPQGHELPHQSKGRPGTRAPHVWVDLGDARVSTLDLVGDGYALFAGPDGRAWLDAARTAAAAFEGLPLAVHRIDSDAFAPAYGISPSGAALIRPDGFVAWRAQELPADPAGVLKDVLMKVLLR